MKVILSLMMKIMSVLREAVCGGTCGAGILPLCSRMISVWSSLCMVSPSGDRIRSILIEILSKDNGDEEVYEPSVEGSFKAQVFKVVSDPHVGKLSYLQSILRFGKIRGYTGCRALKVQKEKFAKFLRPQGGKYEEVQR